MNAEFADESIKSAINDIDKICIGPRLMWADDGDALIFEITLNI